MRSTAEIAENAYPRDAFFSDLAAWTSHERAETVEPFPHAPLFAGAAAVDLYRLFLEVLALGGFPRVNKNNRWSSVLRAVIPEGEVSDEESAAEAAAALKGFYVIWLRSFEDNVRVDIRKALMPEEFHEYLRTAETRQHGSRRYLAFGLHRHFPPIPASSELVALPHHASVGSISLSPTTETPGTLQGPPLPYPHPYKHALDSGVPPGLLPVPPEPVRPAHTGESQTVASWLGRQAMSGITTEVPFQALETDRDKPVDGLMEKPIATSVVEVPRGDPWWMSMSVPGVLEVPKKAEMDDDSSEDEERWRKRQHRAGVKAVGEKKMPKGLTDPWRLALSLMSSEDESEKLWSRNSLLCLIRSEELRLQDQPGLLRTLMEDCTAALKRCTTTNAPPPPSTSSSQTPESGVMALAAGTTCVLEVLRHSMSFLTEILNNESAREDQLEVYAGQFSILSGGDRRGPGRPMKRVPGKSTTPSAQQTQQQQQQLKHKGGFMARYVRAPDLPADHPAAEYDGLDKQVPSDIRIFSVDFVWLQREMLRLLEMIDELASVFWPRLLLSAGLSESQLRLTTLADSAGRVAGFVAVANIVHTLHLIHGLGHTADIEKDPTKKRESPLTRFTIAVRRLRHRLRSGVQRDMWRLWSGLADVAGAAGGCSPRGGLVDPLAAALFVPEARETLLSLIYFSLETEFLSGDNRKRRLSPPPPPSKTDPGIAGPGDATGNEHPVSLDTSRYTGTILPAPELVIRLCAGLLSSSDGGGVIEEASTLLAAYITVLKASPMPNAETVFLPLWQLLQQLLCVREGGVREIAAVAGEEKTIEAPPETPVLPATPAAEPASKPGAGDKASPPAYSAPSPLSSVTTPLSSSLPASGSSLPASGTPLPAKRERRTRGAVLAAVRQAEAESDREDDDEAYDPERDEAASSEDNEEEEEGNVQITRSLDPMEAMMDKDEDEDPAAEGFEDRPEGAARGEGFAGAAELAAQKQEALTVLDKPLRSDDLIHAAIGCLLHSALGVTATGARRLLQVLPADIFIAAGDTAPDIRGACLSLHSHLVRKAAETKRPGECFDGRGNTVEC